MNAESIWQRLGVEAGSDERTIKRAYALKLRDTNPEDDPIGFQALREAYELALSWSDEQWNGLADPIDAEDRADERTQISNRAPESVEHAPGPWDSRIELCKKELFEALTAETSTPAEMETSFENLVSESREIDLLEEAELESWLAAVVAHMLPKSDPLVGRAIQHFGWTDDISRQGSPVGAILHRYRELEVIAQLGMPSDAYNAAWRQLANPPSSRLFLRLRAFAPNIPQQVAALRSAAWNEFPGLSWSFHPETNDWWDEYFSRPRLRLSTLLLIPIWLVLVGGLYEAANAEKSLAADAVWQLAFLVTPAVPFAYLWVRSFNPSFRYPPPEWARNVTSGWLIATPLLPVAAMLVTGYAASIQVAIAAMIAALAMVATTPDAPPMPFGARIKQAAAAIWHIPAIFFLFREFASPERAPAALAVAGLLAMALTRGVVPIAQGTVRAIKHWQGPILYGLGAGVVIAAAYATQPWPLAPGGTNTVVVLAALFGYSIAQLGRQIDPHRTPVLAVVSWIALILLLGGLAPSSGSDGQSPTGTNPVPLADSRTQAMAETVAAKVQRPADIDRVLLRVTDGELDGGKLLIANPKLYQLLATNWDLNREAGGSGREFVATAVQQLDERLAGGWHGATYEILAERFRIQRDQGQSLAAYPSACVRYLKGGDAVPSAGFAKRQAILRAQRLIVEDPTKPPPEPEIGTHRFAVSSDLIRKAAVRAQLDDRTLSAALNYKGLDQAVCRGRLAFLTEVLELPRAEGLRLMRDMAS